ncbi:hypothetical protein GpartN1_g6591.t1 [Galdieria partita]|uniref:Uncharacterized protein n=1 Tax=Galdieria partita TaxID=83374 RepID=A0A9C7UTR1_9RHOD|nr:hypothetical protein GpartN1_g6591.t1 [Galdieria partita]
MVQARSENSLDTSLVFTSTDRSFDLHVHREFQLSDKTKVILSTAANHGDAELLTRAGIEHSFTVGNTWPWKMDLRGEIVPIQKTIASSSIYKTWSLDERTELTMRFQFSFRNNKRERIGRIGVVRTIAGGQQALKFGLGADTKGRRMAAFRDNNLTISTDMEGSWAMKLHFHRKLDEKWI